MTTPPVTEHQPSDDSALYQRALEIGHDPEWSGYLLSRLLYRAPMDQIREAVIDVDLAKARETPGTHAYVTRMAQLEAERAKFLDRNHPGE
jgi:hypothetical protein